MIELTQTSLYPRGNCWQTAVACILEIDPVVMPPQCDYDLRIPQEDGSIKRGPSYNNVLQMYLKKHHNLAYLEFHIPVEGYAKLRIEGYHLMTGTTVRSKDYDGERHVVVGHNGKVVWDPHPSRAGLLDEIHWAQLVPWPAAWNSGWQSGECVCPACSGK